jgi:hypothetical protein
VAVATVADHIQHDITAKLPLIIEQQLDGVNHRFGIMTVDVQDRRLEQLRYIGAVAGRSVSRSGSVVKPIWLLTMTWKVPPVSYAGSPDSAERLGDQALTRKRRVAMDQHAECAAVRSFIGNTLLLGADSDRRRPG